MRKKCGEKSFRKEQKQKYSLQEKVGMEYIKRDMLSQRRRRSRSLDPSHSSRDPSVDRSKEIIFSEPKPKIPPPPTSTGIKALSLPEQSSSSASRPENPSSSSHDEKPIVSMEPAIIRLRRTSSDSSRRSHKTSDDKDEKKPMKMPKALSKTPRKEKNTTAEDKDSLIKILSSHVGEIGIEMLEKLMEQKSTRDEFSAAAEEVRHKHSQQSLHHERSTPMKSIMSIMNHPVVKSILQSVY